MPKKLVQTILYKYHNVQGYFGQQQSQQIISKQFYWLHITEPIQMYCRKCKQFQLFKADTQKLAGFQQPLDIPQAPWEQIHINFVMELPEDSGYGTIMMCIDQFSKMVVLVPLHETDARTVASCFLAEVMIHYGLLVTIISNRDPRFQGSFWKELMINLNTSLSFSTASHP